MSIKELVRDLILQQVLEAVKPKSGWKVLIVDGEALRMISACCRMFDILDRGVTIVELLAKKRKPLPEQDAIYLISPTSKNISYIKDDFVSGARYLRAHVFFIDICPSDLIKQLAILQKVIGTVKELNLNFVPNEAKIFSLDNPVGLYETYSPNSTSGECERIADQLSSLCQLLGEFPVVRYSKDSPAEKIAKHVQERLSALGRQDPVFQKGRKNQGQLIILDRGFDMISPLVHTLTYQAAAYDLLKIPNDVYEYHYQDGGGKEQTKEVVLNEQDKLWLEFRHEHISKVFQGVSSKFDDFVTTKRRTTKLSSKDGSFGTTQLRQMMKDLPQHQQEMNKFGVHLDMSSAILREFSKPVEQCTKVEQNVVMGEDDEGNKIPNLPKEIASVLVDRRVSADDKMRVLALCVICNGGMREEELRQLLDTAELDITRRKLINNLTHVGVRVSTKSPERMKLDRKSRTAEFKLSRWIPLVQDLIEEVIANKLSTKDFPSVNGVPIPKTVASTAAKRGSAAAAAGADDDDDDEGVSARKRGNWSKGPKGAEAAKREEVDSGDRQRIIIFVPGVLSYTEMRIAYDLARENPQFDIFMGSHCLATPKEFLKMISMLSDQRKPALDSVPGFGVAAARMEADLGALGETRADVSVTTV